MERTKNDSAFCRRLRGAAGDSMDRVKQHLIAAFVAAFFCGGAVAGYAQASPPAGWSGPGTGAPFGTYARPANAPAWSAGSAASNVTTNVGGKAINMPAAMRMAANAGRFAGRFAWANPLAFAAGIGIPLVIDWMTSNKLFWNPEQQRWETEEEQNGICNIGPCYEYRVNVDGRWSSWDPSRASACSSVVAMIQPQPGWTWAYAGVTTTGGAGYGECKYTNTWTGGGQPGTFNNSSSFERREVPTQPLPPAKRVPVTQDQMEAMLEPKTVPDAVANALPQMPLPVQQPLLNPGPDMIPMVQRVPMGEPQPVPNSDPQKWQQPVTDITPAPAPGYPFQVDLVPRLVEYGNPDGVKQPTNIPKEGAPVNATPRTGDEEQKDLCATNPDILACQKLDEPDAPELPTREVSVNVSPMGGWGGSAGYCPSPRVTSSGIQIPYDLFCTFFSGIRPIVIACAWLIAAFLVVGAFRSQS